MLSDVEKLRGDREMIEYNFNILYNENNNHEILNVMYFNTINYKHIIHEQFDKCVHKRVFELYGVYSSIFSKFCKVPPYSLTNSPYFYKCFFK